MSITSHRARIRPHRPAGPMMAQMLDLDPATRLRIQAFKRKNAIMIASTSAAVVGVTVGFPFDLIKTRLQAFRYPSTMACIRDIYRSEGFPGFFQGIGPIMVTVSVLRSITFTVYTDVRARLAPYTGATSPLGAVGGLAASSLIAGGVAGGVVCTLNAPLEFIKVQRQLDALMQRAAAAGGGIIVEQQRSKTMSAPAGGLGEGPAPAEAFAKAKAAAAAPPGAPPIRPGRSMWWWGRHVLEVKGVRGLYSGYMWHLGRDGFGTSLYFAFYELCKMGMKGGVEGMGIPLPMVQMLSGGIAGTASWIVLYPIDLVKSVVQREALKPVPKYKSGLAFIRIRWAKNGIRGLSAQLIRAFPLHSINFLVYENVLSWALGKG
ncbi:hypothetical protein HK101_006756 [Irineochytrium annulatum]|nr:hypothetical protein HK101_006756 [Irineochytrium annulatum]